MGSTFLSADESPVFEPKGVHAKLYADAGHYSRLAGIGREWLWQPLAAVCGEAEIQWVTQIRQAASVGVYGVAYMGEPPGQRLDAMCGALVRNFIDARVRGVDRLLKDTESRVCTVLFVPDFCLTTDPPAQFVRQEMISLLFERYRERKQTVLYATSLDAIESAYGDQTSDHVLSALLGDPR